MGKPTGFKEFNRELPPTIDPKTRVNNYKEFYVEVSEDKSKQQAARCMDCGIPFCHNGCPLGNKIPDFNDAAYNGNWREAAEILLSTNNFPEFTGRICPAPCEASCVLGINKPPVAIEFIEKTIIEKAFELDLIKPQPPKIRTGKKVAVVGSGPAGLAAAAQLNKAGHSVTVFERDDKVGGLLRYGIPDFKMEKWTIDRRIRIMEVEGINFKTNTNVGVDISVDELKYNYDAIVLCGGSTIPRDLPIPGRELKGVHFAMEFLTQQNRRVANLEVAEEEIWATDKNVIVIGGGDTGSDCVGTSNRHKAKSITQIELLSKPPVNRGELNPWPEWPMVLRTSSSHEEGADRQWSILTREFVGNNGRLTHLKVVDVEWKDGKLQELDGSERLINADLVLIAAGFTNPQREGMLEQLGVEIDERQNVKSDKYHTSEQGIFVAGDMNRGQSLVVWAISEGREAAKAIDEYLMGDSILESKDQSVMDLVDL
ncbi:MAG: glutamate synthase subunit beta [Bacteroidota bacterium]